MNDGLLIGGKYRLKKLIGSGGMGQVWVGLNEVTEREFAIKLLLPQAATSPDVVTRFIQEAKISGRLRHPGILEIYDVGTAPELQGAPFLVMELLHGVSLEAAIRSLGGLPVRFTLLVAIAITRALRAAHDRGVVHRDLKPANVFLHRDESGAVVPKLLDFGISKLAPSDGADSDALGLTQTGALLGSPRFMSPEQVATQKDIDGRSNLHALGVLVWWCLVARSPFGGSGLHNLMVEILQEERPKLTDAILDVPPGVSDFVSKAFARKRENRYANAGEALVALEAELAKLGPGPTLESGTWYAELLAKVTSPPPPPVLPLPQPARAEGKETTTHGAVSVSVERGNTAPLAPPAASPAAYTLGSASPTPRDRPAREPVRSGVIVALGLGGALVAVVAVAGVLTFGRPQRDHRAGTDREAASSAIAAEALSAAGVPARTAEPTAASSQPAVQPAATQPEVAPPGVPQAATTLANATPDAGAAPTRPPWANRPWRSLGRTPSGTTPAKPTGTDDPFHGVTGTGL